MLSLVAGDVPVLAPTQKLSGSLRASLMQRAPNAVRDFVAASDAQWRPEAASDDVGRFQPGNEAAEDLCCNCSCSPSDPDPMVRVPLEAEAGLVEGEGLGALAVLAEAVAAAPQNPLPKLQPNGITQEASLAAQLDRISTEVNADCVTAMTAVSALAGIGSAAKASVEEAGANIQCTVSELNILADELERCGAASSFWASCAQHVSAHWF